MVFGTPGGVVISISHHVHGFLCKNSVVLGIKHGLNRRTLGGIAVGGGALGLASTSLSKPTLGATCVSSDFNCSLVFFPISVY